MKKILIITALVLIICQEAFSFSFYKSQNLYPINDSKGGGYINSNGDIVLEQKYNFAFNFIGDYAIVEGKNLKKGVIDKNGNIILDIIYDDLENISGHFVNYKKDNKWGFINIITGQKSDAIYDKMKKFQEGYFAVCIDEKWGFINTKGEYIVKPKYYEVSNFSEGLASVSYLEHKTEGYINKKGKMVISFKDNSLNPKEFKEGLAPIIKQNDKSCSYINKRGKIVIDESKIYPKRIYCGNFNNGYNVFYIDNDISKITTGFIDKKGKVKYSMNFLTPKGTSEGEFSVFDDFSSNMAQMTIDYKTGYLDKNFKTAIPPVYEFAKDFNGDLAYVKFEDIEGYINKKGQWVWFKERDGM